jgi:hypothetical protein
VGAGAAFLAGTSAFLATTGAVFTEAAFGAGFAGALTPFFGVTSFTADFLGAGAAFFGAAFLGAALAAAFLGAVFTAVLAVALATGRVAVLVGFAAFTAFPPLARAGFDACFLVAIQFLPLF